MEPMEKGKKRTLSKELRIGLRTFVIHFFAFPLTLLYALWMSTIRVRRLEDKNAHQKFWSGEPLIFAHYHQDIPLIVAKYSFFPFCTMASRSGDGNFITAMLKILGYRVARGSTAKGSTSKGGVAALLEIREWVKKGYHVALTVDGPRGPRGEIQGGTVQLAKHTGLAIVPCGVAVKHAWILPSWDRMMIPLPFTKAVFVAGELLSIPKGTTEDEIDDFKQVLKARLEAVHLLAKEVLISK